MPTSKKLVSFRENREFSSCKDDFILKKHLLFEAHNAHKFLVLLRPCFISQQAMFSTDPAARRRGPRRLQDPGGEGGSNALLVRVHGEAGRPARAERICEESGVKNVDAVTRVGARRGLRHALDKTSSLRVRASKIRICCVDGRYYPKVKFVLLFRK
jgi:hypothetical protein